MTGPEVTIDSDAKHGWCNSCTDRPPYDPEEFYRIRVRTYVVTMCPKCVKDLHRQLTRLIESEGQR